MKTSLFLLATAALQALAAPTSDIKLSIKTSLKSDSLTNVYIDYGSQFFEGTIWFGSCEDGTSMHSIGQVSNRSQKLAWYVPYDAETGCLLAKDASGQLVAQSEQYVVLKSFSKRGHPEFSDMYFDAVDYHNNKKVLKRAAASSKNKKIGIIGAGMSGLFSGFLLDQAGFHNYEILEANDRLGGRVHTTYFGNSGTAYQEMGPMRFPIEFDYKEKTLPITDHQIVFQLVDELNSINKKPLHVEFIKWYQSGDNNLYYKNGYRLANGKIPTVGQVRANANLVPTDGLSALSSQVEAATSQFNTDEWFKLMGSDLYAAHAKAIEEGYDDWSEWAWLHNKMGLSLNATNYATGLSSGNIWSNMYETFTFGRSTNWRTVQGGLNRIANAFEPIVGKKVTFGVKVSKLEFKKNKVSVQWKKSPYDTKYESKKFDNVIVSAPFSVVRGWHLPKLDYILSEAIQGIKYLPACKVALEFKTRFWEHLDRPIQGGCDTTDLLSGDICYPSNNINSTGNGVVLASYSNSIRAQDFAAMTEEDHIGRVLEDFTELHGDLVKKHYTGKYNRRCWSLDHFQAGAWAEAQPGQHKLYMPSYFKMNQGLVFVGEHTDIKHAWISAALESAIRGVVMILVEHGHVDEAKTIVKKYNAKWMKI
ncbi:flavin-containing amine oxidoreductase-domain containing protein [Thamnidium elegans]|nr:flavin-containing amine oxidoreductase-domain containing protein [Thamnidium elegans]